MIEEEIKISELIESLWKNKLQILLVTLLFAVSSVILSLSLPNQYVSKSILVSAIDESSSLSRLNNQLGSLANLSGFSLDSDDASNLSIGIETIKSYKFFEYLIVKYDFLVPLMASKSWDQQSLSLELDSKIYDSSLNKWVRKVSPPKKTIPSYQEAHKKFLEAVTISEDKKNGFITISVKHVSPYIAKDWLDWIIKEINETTRIKAIKKAEDSIDYLNNEISTTQLSDIRYGLNKIIESQIEIAMIASATPEYLFQVIDPPIVSEF